MEMPSWSKSISIVVGLIAIISASIGAYNYFAHAEDLKVVELRLEYKILSDMAYDIRREMAQIEDRNKTNNCLNMTPIDRDRYRKLQIQLEELQRKIDNIRRSQTSGSS
jgi:hypothetical protein